MSVTLPPLDLQGVSWSIAVRDGETGTPLTAHAPDVTLRTASIGKLFTLVAVAERLCDGRLGGDDLLNPGPDDYVEDSGILYRFGLPEVRVSTLALLVGAMSDNFAANILLTACGLESVQRVSQRLGYRSTALLDWVRTERVAGMPPTLSTGTATELSDFMVRLHRGDLVSPGVSALLNDWLAGGADLSMVAGAFDLDPLAHIEPDAGVLLRNKTGTIDTARADVGWIEHTGTGRALSYAVLANWDDQAPESTRHDVLATMQAIGRCLSDELSLDRIPA